MYRIVGLALAVFICAFIQIPSVMVVEASVSAQWNEYFFFYPEEEECVIGEDASFCVYISDSNGNPIQDGLIQLLVVEGANIGTSCSARTGHLNVPGWACPSYEGVNVGYDKVLLWYDKDEDNGWDSSEEPGGYANVDWYFYYLGINYPCTEIFGMKIEISAELYGHVPLGGVLIRFEVKSGPNQGVSGSAYTDWCGRAGFSYVGSGGPGEDTILIYTDLDEDGVWEKQDGEYGCIIEIYWTVPFFSVSPEAASPPVNNEMCIEARLDPPMGTYPLTFEVTSGPNAGLKQTIKTDEAGIARFKYVSKVVGYDTVDIYHEGYPNLFSQRAHVFWMGRLEFSKYELVSSQWQRPYYTAKLYAYITNPTNVPGGISASYFTAYDVTAFISGVPPWTQVLDGSLSFKGSVGPGKTVRSDDTFEIRVNTKEVGNPKTGITWTVEYRDPWGNLHVITGVPQLR